MSGFNYSSISYITIPDIPDYLPLIINDCSLASHLGFSVNKLWYVLATRDQQHYERFKIKKKNGKYRTIHNPSKVLKLMQRNLLRTLLEPLQERLGPHVAAYRPDRSVVDAVKRHIPKCPICDNRTDPYKTLPAHDCPKAGTYINLDLKDFFPSTTCTYVRNYFKSLGYSHYVSSLMANLIIIRYRINPNYTENSNRPKYLSEVPQGAPTSGAICNLIADKLIDRPILKYLKQQNVLMGIDNTPYKWVYSRYADDIALTCGKKLAVNQIRKQIEEIKKIINKSKYRVNNKKTRYMYGITYQKRLLGMVFNERPNYAQHEYKKLRAITHNCLTQGFESQYLRAKKESAGQLESWLKGVINWINQINPEKADKLKKEFDVAVTKYGINNEQS